MLEGIVASLIAAAVGYMVARACKRPDAQVWKDVRRYVHDLIEEMENANTGSAVLYCLPQSLTMGFDVMRHYVPLTAVQYVFIPDEETPRERICDNVEIFISEWIARGNESECFILGDFGTGKSSLAARVFYELASRRSSPFQSVRLPLMIPLRYLQQPDIIEACAQLMRDRYNIVSCTRHWLVKSVRAGTVVLILDGLDEYCRNPTELSVYSVFQILRELRTPKAKIIVTSRPCVFRGHEELIEYFRGDHDSSRIIAKRAYCANPMVILELKQFSDEQIGEFLSKRIQADEEVRNTIYKNESVHELARQPILLDMIVETLPQMVSEKDAGLLHIMDVAELYDFYTSTIITRERWRVQISESDATEVLMNVALHIFNGRQEEIEKDALRGIVSSTVGSEYGSHPEVESLTHEIGSSLFMVASGQQRFRFSHRTLMEFFVAKGLVKAIRRHEFSVLDLERVVYHEAISHFARGLLRVEDLPMLVSLLDHEQPWARFIAAHYLSRLSASEAVGPVQQRLRSERDLIVRREFYIALAFLGRVSEFSAFVEELDHDQIKDRMNDDLIVQYFGGALAAIEGCTLRLTERKDYPTREMIIRFVGHKGARRQIPILRTYLEDTIERIGARAKVAIDSIKDRSRSPSPVRAVLLDVDGVVVNSIDNHITAWCAALKAIKGIDLDPCIIRLTEGRRSRDVAKSILNLHGVPVSDDDVDMIVTRKHELMENMEALAIIPETRSFIEIARRRGVRVVLVTASIRTRAIAVAKTVGPGLIDSVVCGEDTTKGKPSPEPYTRALETIHCSAEDAIAVENAPLGIDSAQGAGVYCIALTSTLQSKYLECADQVVSNPLEICRLL